VSTLSPPIAAPAPHSITRAFRHPNYRLFFGGQLVSLVGTFLSQTATLWFVYSLTGSYAVMGTVAFLGQLPVFILTPIAGVVADRVQRRRFIVLTQALSMLQSFGVAAVVFWFGADRRIAIPSLIGLSVFQGIVNAFDLPARQAFLVEMVTDRADLPNAIALNSTMVHGARVIGPAAAGLIIHFVGISLCFVLDGFSYLAVIAALLMMVVVPRPARPKGSFRTEMIDGFRYVWKTTPVRTLLIFMGLLSLTGLPVVQLMMPVFGDYFGTGNHFARAATGAPGGRGSAVFGLLSAASGIGALVGAVHLAMRRSVLGLGRLIFFAVGIFGLAVIAIGQSRVMWLTFCIVPFIGFGMIVAFASSNTIIQTIVDDDKRGRVMSFFGMAFLGMAPFGSLLGGRVAHLLTPADGDMLVGASRTLLIAGSISVAAALVYLTRLPAMRLAARPIYIAKGILPQVAVSLEVADTVLTEGEK
jgi:MFS family permease